MSLVSHRIRCFRYKSPKQLKAWRQKWANNCVGQWKTGFLFSYSSYFTKVQAGENHIFISRACEWLSSPLIGTELLSASVLPAFQASQDKDCKTDCESISMEAAQHLWHSSNPTTDAIHTFYPLWQHTGRRHSSWSCLSVFVCTYSKCPIRFVTLQLTSTLMEVSTEQHTGGPFSSDVVSGVGHWVICWSYSADTIIMLCEWCESDTLMNVDYCMSRPPELTAQKNAHFSGQVTSKMPMSTDFKSMAFEFISLNYLLTDSLISIWCHDI